MMKKIVDFRVARQNLPRDFQTIIWKKEKSQVPFSYYMREAKFLRAIFQTSFFQTENLLSPRFEQNFDFKQMRGLFSIVVL